MRKLVTTLALVFATTAVAKEGFKWQPLNFPIGTQLEVSLEGRGGQKILGDLKPFYAWIKELKLKCRFDNADLSSGLQTIECDDPREKEHIVLDVEYMPSQNKLRIDEAYFPGFPRNTKTQAGAFFNWVYNPDLEDPNE